MVDKPHAWLFGDGSCGAHDDMGAWASIAVSAAGDRKLITGSACPTTISRCELMPIIEGVEWIYKNWAKRINGFRLNVYSDSNYTVRTLNGEYNANKNKGIWKGMQELIKLPIHYKFIWVARNSLPYMELCDAIAGSVRKSSISMMKTLMHVEDHRMGVTTVPVEPLPKEEIVTIIPEDIKCQHEKIHGGYSIPQIPILDLNNMGSMNG